MDQAESGGRVEPSDHTQAPWTDVGRVLVSHALTWPLRRMDGKAEDVCAVGGHEGVKEQKQGVDWVAALQSPHVAEKIADDIIKAVQEGDGEWFGPGPNTLAFLEDMKQTLRLER